MEDLSCERLKKAEMLLLFWFLIFLLLI